MPALECPPGWYNSGTLWERAVLIQINPEVSLSFGEFRSGHGVPIRVTELVLHPVILPYISANDFDRMLLTPVAERLRRFRFESTAASDMGPRSRSGRPGMMHRLP